MRLKYILLAILGIVVSFFASLWAMDRFAPRAPGGGPALAATPPLPPAVRISTILAPVEIRLTAIRDAVERAAPRTFAGKADNPAPQIISNADVAWSVARGAIAVSGAQNAIALSTPLNGDVKATGSLSQEAVGAIGGLLGGLLGGDAARQIGQLNIKQLNADAEIKGNVAVTLRPQLLPNWRVDPGIAAQVNLADTSVTASGMRIGLSNQLRPLMDRMVNEQIASAQERFRNDPVLEQTARREWAKMCRSIPLPPAPGMPPLFLEMRPVKAVAAQPRVDAENVRLTIGIEAQTGVTASQTAPQCPFPATLEIAPPRDTGEVKIGVPIDMPFTEVNRLIDAQLVGRTFPEGGAGPVAVTVKRATVAPSGERLLISLLVSAKESRSWFGLGGDATVHVWGKPALDAAQQTLRLVDIELAVESEAAFGLLGAAARAAMPYLQGALAERAAIDLKPFATEAKTKIAAAVNDLRMNDKGVVVDARIDGVRLAGIAFDAAVLRVIAEADGAVNVTVTQLPGL